MNTLIALSPGLLWLAVLLPCFIAGSIGRRCAAERERAAAEARAAAKRRAEEAKRAAALEKQREAARKAEEKAAKQQAKQKKPAQKKPKQAERASIIPAEIDAAQPFAGEAVAFTGTCPKMERRAMIAHTQRLGGKGYETINTRCTLLVIGEHPGRNQQERAAKWHIPTVTWQEWHRRAFGPDSLPQPKPADLSKFLTPSQFADQYAA